MPRPDHPPTWSRYADLAPLLNGAGLTLTPNDYDYAARCVNVHDELLAALHLCISALAANDAPNCEAVKEARAAIAKAEG